MNVEKRVQNVCEKIIIIIRIIMRYRFDSDSGSRIPIFPFFLLFSHSFYIQLQHSMYILCRYFSPKVSSLSLSLSLSLSFCFFLHNRYKVTFLIDENANDAPPPQSHLFAHTSRFSIFNDIYFFPFDFSLK